MLLKDYRLEIFNNECMPGAMSVQCIAHLDLDVGPALPYLNTVLGGFEYIDDPPSVTFIPLSIIMVRNNELRHKWLSLSGAGCKIRIAKS